MDLTDIVLCVINVSYKSNISNIEKGKVMADIFVIGDALIDYIPTAEYHTDLPVYQCNVGGTMVNLASAAAKLGLEVVFCGKVGADAMGSYILREMEKLKVDVSKCPVDPEHFTTQAFVSLSEAGERDFSFSRRFGADIFLKAAEVPYEELGKCRVVCSSGLGITDEPIRSTVYDVIKAAGQNSAVTTVFDVNYREKLWQTPEIMRCEVMKLLPFIDIFKSSEEEIMLLTDAKNFGEAAEKVMEYGCRLVIATNGSKGTKFRYGDYCGYEPAFRVPVMDTTGAGDCFLAAFLYQYCCLEQGRELKKEDLHRMVEFANAAGSLATTRKGGVAGSPYLEDILGCLRTNARLYDDSGQNK